MTDNEKSNKIDELEHQVLVKTKLQGVKGQVMSLGDTLHQRIDSLESKNETEFSYIREALDDIKKTGKDTLIQATKTNSRVNKIENEKLSEKLDEVKKQTRVVRFMHQYPIITITIALFAYLFTIVEIRTVVIEYVEKFFFLFGKLF